MPTAYSAWTPTPIPGINYIPSAVPKQTSTNPVYYENATYKQVGSTSMNGSLPGSNPFRVNSYGQTNGAVPYVFPQSYTSVDIAGNSKTTNIDPSYAAYLGAPQQPGQASKDLIWYRDLLPKDSSGKTASLVKTAKGSLALIFEDQKKVPGATAIPNTVKSYAL